MNRSVIALLVSVLAVAAAIIGILGPVGIVRPARYDRSGHLTVTDARPARSAATST